MVTNRHTPAKTTIYPSLPAEDCPHDDMRAQAIEPASRTTSSGLNGFNVCLAGEKGGKGSASVVLIRGHLATRSQLTARSREALQKNKPNA